MSKTVYEIFNIDPNDSAFQQNVSTYAVNNQVDQNTAEWAVAAKSVDGGDKIFSSAAAIDAIADRIFDGFKDKSWMSETSVATSLLDVVSKDNDAIRDNPCYKATESKIERSGKNAIDGLVGDLKSNTNMDISRSDIKRAVDAFKGNPDLNNLAAKDSLSDEEKARCVELRAEIVDGLRELCIDSSKIESAVAYDGNDSVEQTADTSDNKGAVEESRTFFDVIHDALVEDADANKMSDEFRERLNATLAARIEAMGNGVDAPAEPVTKADEPVDETTEQIDTTATSSGNNSADPSVDAPAHQAESIEEQAVELVATDETDGENDADLQSAKMSTDESDAVEPQVATNNDTQPVEESTAKVDAFDEKTTSHDDPATPIEIIDSTETLIESPADTEHPPDTPAETPNVSDDIDKEKVGHLAKEALAAMGLPKESIDSIVARKTDFDVKAQFYAERAVVFPGEAKELAILAGADRLSRAALAADFADNRVLTNDYSVYAKAMQLIERRVDEPACKEMLGAIWRGRGDVSIVLGKLLGVSTSEISRVVADFASNDSFVKVRDEYGAKGSLTADERSHVLATTVELRDAIIDLREKTKDSTTNDDRLPKVENLHLTKEQASALVEFEVRHRIYGEMSGNKITTEVDAVNKDSFAEASSRIRNANGLTDTDEFDKVTKLILNGDVADFSDIDKMSDEDKATLHDCTLYAAAAAYKEGVDGVSMDADTRAAIREIRDAYIAGGDVDPSKYIEGSAPHELATRIVQEREYNKEVDALSKDTAALSGKRDTMYKELELDFNNEELKEKIEAINTDISDKQNKEHTVRTDRDIGHVEIERIINTCELVDEGIEKHPNAVCDGIEKVKDEVDSSTPKTETDTSADSVEKLVDEYKDRKDRLSDSNSFVCLARLEANIAAYNAGVEGVHGKMVDGGDIAVDFMRLMKSDLFGSIVELAVREYFSFILPAKDVEQDKKDSADSQILFPREFIQKIDSGANMNPIETKVDLHRVPTLNGELEARYSDATVYKTDAPIEWHGKEFSTRYVEAENGAKFLVDPFGSIVWSNVDSALTKDVRLEKLDVSKDKATGDFIAEHRNGQKFGVTRDAIGKETVTVFIDKTVEHFKDKADTTARDIDVLKSDRASIQSKVDRLSEIKEKVDTYLKVLPSNAPDRDRMDTISKELGQNIDRLTTLGSDYEGRIERLGIASGSYDSAARSIESNAQHNLVDLALSRAFRAFEVEGNTPLSTVDTSMTVDDAKRIDAIIDAAKPYGPAPVDADDKTAVDIISTCRHRDTSDVAVVAEAEELDISGLDRVVSGEAIHDTVAEAIDKYCDIAKDPENTFSFKEDFLDLLNNSDLSTTDIQDVYIEKLEEFFSNEEMTDKGTIDVMADCLVSVQEYTLERLPDEIANELESRIDAVLDGADLNERVEAYISELEERYSVDTNHDPVDEALKNRVADALESIRNGDNGVDITDEQIERIAAVVDKASETDTLIDHISEQYPDFKNALDDIKADIADRAERNDLEAYHEDSVDANANQDGSDIPENETHPETEALETPQEDGAEENLVEQELPPDDPDVQEIISTEDDMYAQGAHDTPQDLEVPEEGEEYFDNGFDVDESIFE